MSMSDSEEDSDVSVSEDDSEQGDNGGHESSNEHKSDEEDPAEMLKLKHESTKPPPIYPNGFTSDICLHNSKDMIAVGDIKGDVSLYEYNIQYCTLLGTLESHSLACRGMDFTCDGTRLISVSKDKSIIISDLETMNMVGFIDQAHEHPLCGARVVDEHCYLTGDEAGVLKLWDLRSTKQVFSNRRMSDYITSIVYSATHEFIACTTSDGVVSVFDYKKRECVHQTEPVSSDLNACTLYREDTRIACASSDGAIWIVRWPEFKTEKFYPGPKKKEISSLVAVTDNILISAWDDGILRASHVNPNYPIDEIGVIKKSNYEKLDISHDGRLIAASTSSPSVLFYDVSRFERKQIKPKKRLTMEAKARTNFFQALS